MITTNVPANPTTVQTHGSGSAQWSLDGLSGNVNLDYGWSMTGSGSRMCGLDNDSGSLGPDWDYQFTADYDGIFTFNYDVVGSGNTFGLRGWEFWWSGPEGNDGSFTDVMNPTHSGTIVRELLAGQTYDVGLWTEANLLNGSGNDITADMMGTFSWSITPAPEPTCGAVGVAGLVLFCLRKRIGLQRQSKASQKSPDVI